MPATALHAAVLLNNPPPPGLARSGRGLLEAQDEEGDTVLSLASTLGRLDWVVALLQAGADATAHNAAGATALELAQQYGHTDIAELLAAAAQAQAQGAGQPLRPRQQPRAGLSAAAWQQAAQQQQVKQQQQQQQQSGVPGHQLRASGAGAPPAVPCVPASRAGVTTDREVEVLARQLAGLMQWQDWHYAFAVAQMVAEARGQAEVEGVIQVRGRVGSR